MKKILSIFLVLLSVCMVFSSVLAKPDREPVLPSNADKTHGDIVTLVRNSWTTIATIVQIGAVACFVFAGLRYMFASADQKADIKKGLIYLGIGALIVFGATTIARLIITGAESIL